MAEPSSRSTVSASAAIAACSSAMFANLAFSAESSAFAALTCASLLCRCLTASAAALELHTTRFVDSAIGAGVLVGDAALLVGDAALLVGDTTGDAVCLCVACILTAAAESAEEFVCC